MGGQTGYNSSQNPGSLYQNDPGTNSGYSGGSTFSSPSVSLPVSQNASTPASEFVEFYKQYLDRHYPNASPLEDSPYTRNRDYYTLIAYGKAFGQKDDSWQPDQGFKANESIIRKLYDYYQATYLEKPERFLWAGLGRMAGGAVLGGLLAPGLPDPSYLTSMMVLIGKSIFLDLAWQHELFTADPAKAVAMAKEHDTRFPAKVKYEAAWTKISSNNAKEIAMGNALLLENEQFTIIQTLYDEIKRTVEVLTAYLFSKISAFTNSIHPYHLGFFQSFPTTTKVDITVAEDRWNWIMMSKGMWEKWLSIPSSERTRLVRLSMADLIAKKWGPVIEVDLPVGAP